MNARARRWLTLALLVLVGVAAARLFYLQGRTYWVPAYQKLAGRQTVQDVLERYGNEARDIWRSRLSDHGIEYPPSRVTLLAFKDERMLEVWAWDEDERVQIATYAILGASGTLGPKLHEGDLQVPEGIYAIEGLNPNSAFHLSLKLNYPNKFDRARANEEGRSHLGGDIFIHGKRASVGCLAMGDEAIEELFVLVADVGRENVEVVVAPVDLRVGPPPDIRNAPGWLEMLYEAIQAELDRYETIEGAQ